MLSGIVAGSMVAEGVVSGLLAYAMFRKKRARIARCQRTWGYVIEVKEHPGGEGPTKHPVIRYQAPGGAEVTFESKFGRSNWKVEPGDRLEILVNPGSPSEAEVVSFMAQWGVPLILGVNSVGSVILAPVVYHLLRL